MESRCEVHACPVSADNDLPPRPDSDTGQPFPPHAPGYDQQHDGKNDARPAEEGGPTSPPGMGRTLAWYRESARSRLTRWPIALSIAAVVMAIVFLIFDQSLDGMAAWPVWVVLLVGSFLMADPFADSTVAAGADWVSHRRRYLSGLRSSYEWVKTYELTRIDGSNAPTGSGLSLSDEERDIGISVADLQHDRRVWDLLYNGILHSIANGAHANSVAMSLLKLSDEVEDRAISARVDLAEATMLDPAALSDDQVRQIMRLPVGTKIRDRNGIPHDTTSIATFREALEHEVANHPAIVLQAFSDAG